MVGETYPQGWYTLLITISTSLVYFDLTFQYNETLILVQENKIHLEKKKRLG